MAKRDALARELESRLEWLRPWLDRSIRLAQGNPRGLRGVPLSVCCALARLELWKLRHGL
jgi:hypothetical protein